MKVLIVCSGTAPDFDFSKHQAFIYDQAEAIQRLGKEVILNTFFIKRKGIRGYLREFPEMMRKVRSFKPDIIHAHGGHIGSICNLQWKIPVVVTFHGSDINLKMNRCISSLAAIFTDTPVYVSQKLLRKAIVKGKNPLVIPCGVDFGTFYPLSMPEAKKALNLPVGEPYILFSSHFDNPVKNYGLVQEALKQLPPVTMHEIRDRTRDEVNLLINGASLLLMTSFSEGSPQIIKEAMACNCPIVSTDVGDVREVIGDTEGCYITTFDPTDVAEKIRFALAFGKRTNGREKIGHLDNEIIAGEIVEVYKQVLKMERG